MENGLTPRLCILRPESGQVPCRRNACEFQEKPLITNNRQPPHELLLFVIRDDDLVIFLFHVMCVSLVGMLGLRERPLLMAIARVAWQTIPGFIRRRLCNTGINAKTSTWLTDDIGNLKHIFLEGWAQRHIPNFFHTVQVFGSITTTQHMVRLGNNFTSAHFSADSRGFAQAFVCSHCAWNKPHMRQQPSLLITVPLRVTVNSLDQSTPHNLQTWLSRNLTSEAKGFRQVPCLQFTVDCPGGHSSGNPAFEELERAVNRSGSTSNIPLFLHQRPVNLWPLATTPTNKQATKFRVIDIARPAHAMDNKQFFDPRPISGWETTLLIRLFWWWVVFFSQLRSTLFNSNTSVSTIKRTNVKHTSSQLLRRPRPFRGDCFCSNRSLKSNNITSGSTGGNFKTLHGANSRFRPQPASQEKSLFWTKPSHQPVAELPALQCMSPEDPTHVL